MDVGVVGPHPDVREVQYEVRCFFQGTQGLTEDPVTGSFNAAVGQWLIGAGIAPARYVAAQGTAIGRAGRIAVSSDGTDVWVGGGAVTVMRGEVVL